MIWLVGLLSLLVGFLIGVVARDAFDLMLASRRERSMNRTKVTRGALATGLVVAVLLQFSVGVLLVLTYNRTGDYSECTGKWQQQFGTAYRARLGDSVKVQAALDNVISAVSTRDEAAFKSSIRRYVKLREEQDEGRKANPLPPLPEQLCGTPGGSG